ncbi:DUF5667 domain-containing protein [Nocardioides KLBMP 9356]|uniref:DUF5667 domain-containing protein n=1 Tax=Nocardioides potassii TaxID=2911371 RepID=A0ABS9HI08_9ACTN|nr:DUF5667 domain-containing protein [Nocardioides potassii]MCF6380037.1 DUF5667 domain-containing protein [Nocardioides potassii]
MTSAFSARRRADEFEALLDRGPGAHLTDREAARFAELVAVVSELRAMPEVEPRAEFVGSLRERLMAEADTVLVRQPPAPQRLQMPSSTRPRQRRVATLLGGAALVGATATMAVAAQTSLPGESLYGVKRGIESAQVRLAGDDSARGRALLAQAETRLTELEELAAGTGGAEQLIPDTLDTFTEQSGEGVRSLLTAYGSGGSDEDVEVARAFTSSSMDRLDALQRELPASASDELLAAGRTLTDLDTEISTACGLCDGALTTTPDFLLTNAAVDLVQGLDTDEVTLETAALPIPGQDVSGITVPKALQTPGGLLPSPTSTPTDGLPTTSPTTLLPGTPTPTATPTPTRAPDPTKPVKDVTTTVTDTTGNLTNQLDGLTGGALGGLTSGVDDATGGLIGEVTGTLDGATSGLLGNATGGLLH